MADCRIVNETVKNAVENIRGLQQQYVTAGQNFTTAFTAAIADMEGDAKDALLELYTKTYKVFVEDEEQGLPAMIKGMAELLEANRTNFEQVDSQIAQSIREGSQG